MNLIDLLILSIALGMDCLIVSFSQGLIYKADRIKNCLKLSIVMGFFQGLMPFLSYIGTDFIQQYIEPFEKWLVFVIFMCLGFKFIIEAFFEKEDESICLDWKCLIWLGIATSIDALASGINLNLTNTPILKSCLIIGFISLLMSNFGFWSCEFFKKLPSKNLEISGGIILIFLALRAL